MVIRAFIGDASFDPEALIVLNEAFGAALAELRTDRTDPLAAIVARKIIESARLGERDPKRLSEMALQNIRILQSRPPQAGVAGRLQVTDGGRR